jgi:amino acid transporter
VFKEIDPKTKVCVKGAWLTCVFVCIISFFLNLEELTKIISLGILLNYSFVNAGVMALRFRSPNPEAKNKIE